MPCFVRNHSDITYQKISDSGFFPEFFLFFRLVLFFIGEKVWQESQEKNNRTGHNRDICARRVLDIIYHITHVRNVENRRTYNISVVNQCAVFHIVSIAFCAVTENGWVFIIRYNTSNCQAKCNSLVEKVNRRNKVKTLPGAIVNQIKNSIKALS